MVPVELARAQVKRVMVPVELARAQVKRVMVPVELARAQVKPTRVALPQATEAPIASRMHLLNICWLGTLQLSKETTKLP